MKVFFDTNVYVAEAILGGAAERMVEATRQASWRVHCCQTVLDEVHRVLVGLGFSRRLSTLTQARILRRSDLTTPGSSKHFVPGDPHDSPILVAALTASADYLVTNNAHLLVLDPYEGMRVVSMDAYYRLLVNEGIIVD